MDSFIRPVLAENCFRKDEILARITQVVDPRASCLWIGTVNIHGVSQVSAQSCLEICLCDQSPLSNWLQRIIYTFTFTLFSKYILGFTMCQHSITLGGYMNRILWDPVRSLTGN